MIVRCPNGVVPPAIHDDKTPTPWRHDVQCNAEQFMEEKVIPVLLPRVLARLRR